MVPRRAYLEFIYMVGRSGIVPKLVFKLQQTYLDMLFCTLLFANLIISFVTCLLQKKYYWQEASFTAK
jgi:flagellar biosynthesis component FlhA